MGDRLFSAQIVKNNMKSLIFLNFAILFSSLVTAGDFVYGLDDIPVYKDMTYVENSNVLFDKINGRFVSSEMIGNYKINDIKEFYTSVLPNLGWEKVNENLFQRDGEFLEIELKSDDDLSKIIFSIYPK